MNISLFAKRIRWLSSVDCMADLCLFSMSFRCRELCTAVQFQKLGNSSQKLQRFGRLSPHLIVLVLTLEFVKSIGFTGGFAGNCAFRFPFLD